MVRPRSPKLTSSGQKLFAYSIAAKNITEMQHCDIPMRRIVRYAFVCFIKNPTIPSSRRI